MVNMVFEYPPSPHTLVFPESSYGNVSLSRNSHRFAATSMCAQKTPPPTPLGARTSMAIRLVPPPAQPSTMKAEHHNLPDGPMSETVGYRQPGYQPSAPPLVPTDSGSSSTPTSTPSQTPSRPPFIVHNASFPPPNLPPHFSHGGAMRRQSRFDPMGREEEDEEEAYGELGHRHPLRRIQEDPSKELPEPVSLPGIKALFGAADSNNHPPTPSTSGSLFQSPSLPSLSGSGSPSSSARTSRYSSLASSNVDQSGWWAPDIERNHSYSQPSSRNNSITPYSMDDERDQKRRRSDQAPVLRDAEESARLRRQAQSRNASFPNVSPGLRGMTHPLPSPSEMTGGPLMSRPSISGPIPLSSPLALEHGGTVMFDRRESGMSRRDSSMSTFSRRESMASRSSSFAGPLARSFADLSANDRASPTTESPATMLPPASRSPTIPTTPLEMSRPLVLARAATDSVPVLRDSFAGSRSGPMTVDRRMSLTRPPSPENPIKSIRRSSLTELIMAKTGDDVAIARGGSFYADTPSSDTTPTNAPAPGTNMITTPVAAAHAALSAVSEPTPSWSRRESGDSVVSAHGISLNSDNEGPMGSTSGSVKRRYDPRNPYPAMGGPMDEDEEGGRGDPGMRGMEVLAESARRVADAERGPGMRGDMDREDREPSPSKGGAAGPKYTCAYCAKTFSRPSSLRIHTYSHTGERPFICPEPTCRRRFSVQSNLKRHAKVHQLGGGAAPTSNSGTYTPPTHLGPLMTPTRGMNGPPPSGPPPPPGGPVMHPPPAIYGYPPSHHPHQGGPGPGYPPGPPPPGFLAHPQPPPPPGYESVNSNAHAHPGHSHPHQPHFAVAPRMPPHPPPSEHMQAHYRELQRRRSMEQEREREQREHREVQRRASGGMIGGVHGRHSGPHGGREAWSDEEDEIEEDELDDEEFAAPPGAGVQGMGVKEEVRAA